MKTNSSVAGWSWGINFVSIQQPSTSVKNQFLDIETLKLFPNPSRGQVNVNFALRATSEILNNILDLSGKIVLSKGLGKIQEGSHTIPFELIGLPSGQFVVQVISSQGFKTGLIICI